MSSRGISKRKNNEKIARTFCRTRQSDECVRSAKYLYPQADIPVVQLSLDRNKSPQWHYELAKKLRPLREQGVLILGSGDIVHNLRAISWEHIDQVGAGYDWAYQFRDEINQAMHEHNDEALIYFEQFGESAALSVPTPDHYLPLLYVMA